MHVTPTFGAASAYSKTWQTFGAIPGQIPQAAAPASAMPASNPAVAPKPAAAPMPLSQPGLNQVPGWMTFAQQVPIVHSGAAHAANNRKSWLA